MDRGNNKSADKTQGSPPSQSHGEPNSTGETSTLVAEPSISSRKYTIPFGRYEGSDRAPAPAHESMIGRIRQRARLLNLLFTQGRRGAYLITGHRGAGKTSFVEDAIATYRRDVFRRFLRSDVGRGFFLDRLGLLGLLVSMVTGLLILKHLLWFLLLNPTAPRLPGLVAIPIVVVFCLPLFMAAGIIEPVVKWLFSRKVDSPKADTRSHAISALADRVWGGGGAIWAGLLTLIFASHDGVPCATPATWSVRFLRWPWTAHVTAALGAFLVFALFIREPYSRLRGSTQARADSRTEVSSSGDKTHEGLRERVGLPAMIVSLGAIFLAGLFAYLQSNDLMSVASVSVVLSCFLFGVSSENGRRIALPILMNNGAEIILTIVLGTLVYFVGDSVPPIVPLGIVVVLSALISLIRALDLTALSMGGLRFVRGIRALLVLLYLAGALLVLYAILARERTLEQLWLPVLTITIMELGIPHYFASPEDDAYPQSNAPSTQAKDPPSAILTERKAADSKGSRERSLWRRTCASAPLLLTVVAKSTGLTLISANLLQPAILWAKIRLSPDNGPLDRPWPFDVSHDLLWILWSVLFLMAITRLEYDWIHRPSEKELAGPTSTKPGRKSGSAEEMGPALEQLVSDSQSRTFFYAVWEAWLPVLKVNVNLGIDALSHRRVIEVMMTALRDAYQRTFAHWRSPLSVLGASLRLGVVLFFMTLGGSFFFSFSDKGGELANRNYCGYLQSHFDDLHPGSADQGQVSHVYDWACSTRYGNDIIRGLRFNFLDPSASYRSVVAEEPKHLGNYFLPTSFFGATDGLSSRTREQVELRTYHVFLILLLYWITGAFLKRWPLLPYQDISKRLQRVLDSLTSSIDETATEGWSSGYNNFPLAPKRERSVQTRTAPLDSRRVELMFLSVLRDIHFAGLTLPLNQNARLHLPAAEIIFVFDELDKASLEIPRSKEDEDETPDDPRPEGARRLAALLALFADMKNVLSAAPARFFFVGGRDLHDAWLADQMARQPLLTRIFDDEVYLPSLLTDAADTGAASHDQIAAYLRTQIWRAGELLKGWSRARHGAWLGIWQEDRRHATFEPESRRASWPPVESDPTSWFETANTGSRPPAQAFWNDLIAFLAYRSSGNVKRLRELIEVFLQPRKGAERGSESEQREHDLVFHDEDIHRIQLLADIYRGIERAFHGTPMMRDDKVVTSLFYISNTLLKFHRQAFNLANFERIDEVVDVHRSPEIRGVVHELLGWWTGPLLRPVHNGVFAYRFRSEVAQELKFAARLSEEEMAALHFALDESRTLKDLYRARLEASEATPSAEIAAALGEIHDLDGEYDSARYYYLFATKLLDEKLQVDIRGGYHDLGGGDAVAAVYEVLRGEKDKGVAIAARRLPWANARLRLMLQIGLTYEHEKDYDRALIEYRNARILAAVILNALNPRATGADALPSLAGLPLGSLHRLLVQPGLAEVFAAEKLGLPGVSSTDDLGELLGGLDARFDPGMRIVRADVLARRGDLHFFRGSPGTARDLPGRSSYDAALRELSEAPSPHRDRLCSRILASLSDAFLAGALFVTPTSADTTPVLLDDRLTMEALFGQACAQEQTKNIRAGLPRAIQRLKEFALSTACFSPQLADDEKVGEVKWLLPSAGGFWDLGAPARDGQGADEISPLIAGVLCSLAAADFMREEGSAWDAALEEQRIADALSRLLWWRRLTPGAPEPSESVANGCACLLWIADESIEKAFEWWDRGGQSPVPAPSRGGGADGVNRQWNALLVTACRLLAIARWLSSTTNASTASRPPHTSLPKTQAVMQKLWERLREVPAGFGGTSPEASVSPERAKAKMADLTPETVLIDLLCAYSFPMLTRLRAMALWIEATVMEKPRTISPLLLAALDLIRSERAYRARLLFTPIEIAVPLALIASHAQSLPPEIGRNSEEYATTLDEIKTLATAHLLRAKRQVTQRRAYYEAISDMHYLADDFNEPRIRGSHALQRAARPLADNLLRALRTKDCGTEQRHHV